MADVVEDSAGSESESEDELEKGSRKLTNDLYVRARTSLGIFRRGISNSVATGENRRRL